MLKSLLSTFTRRQNAPAVLRRTCKMKFIIINGNITEWSQFALKTYERLTKSDNREARVRFVNHEYDYRQNWTTRSAITN